MTYKLSREFNDILKCLSSRVFLKSWYYGRSTGSEWASKFVNRFTSGWPSLVLVSETHWRIRSYLQNFEIPEYLDIQAVLRAIGEYQGRAGSLIAMATQRKHIFS